MPPKFSKEDTDKVRFKSHFPHTFLKAYGRCYPVQTKNMFMYHVKLSNCEWLQRPNIAVSEFADTILENIDVMEQYRDVVIGSEYLNVITEFY